ncbi:MAG: YerC/YecD family TrpR-related protein [Candidatus Berkelbacteria bacterium]
MIKNNKKQDWINPYTDSLFEVILKLKDLNESRKFFRDLFTEKEILEFSQRWRVAKMLNDNLSYIKIEQETGMSSATIARIHKWLKKGSGGYLLMINK